MKYRVNVARTVTAHREIVVDVAHESMIEAAALEQAPNEVFGSGGDAGYAVEGWVPVPDEPPNGKRLGDRDGRQACEECGAVIPVVEGGGQANRHHQKSCSLYDASKE